MVAASTAFSPSSTMTASLVESTGLPSAAIPVHEDGNNGNGDSSADGSGDDGGMVRSLSLWNYFTMGFGAIIGTVWVLLVGDWMIVGGGPVEAMIAFVLGAVFLLPIGSTSGAVTMVGSFLPGVLVMTPLFYTGFDTIPQSAEEASEGLDWKKFGMVISASLLAGPNHHWPAGAAVLPGRAQTHIMGNRGGVDLLGLALRWISARSRRE